MIKAMVSNGFSGWYLRVLEPGELEAGASITLVERLNPAWPITRINHVMHTSRTRDELAELADLPGLASNLKISARAALEALTINRVVNPRK